MFQLVITQILNNWMRSFAGGLVTQWFGGSGWKHSIWEAVQYVEGQAAVGCYNGLNGVSMLSSAVK